MKYKLLGKSGLRVSELCLGTMTFGEDWGWGASQEESKKIFDAFANAGGNFIDTASLYTEGTSEKYTGEFIAIDRGYFVVATKYTLRMRGDNQKDPNRGGNQRKNMVQTVEDSLRRLGTDYIDILYVHAWDDMTPIDEVMRGLDDLVRAGKVLYIAVSDHPAWTVSQANTLAELKGWSRFVACQVPYSLARRDIEREILPMANDLDIAITPWAILGGGVLTGKYRKKGGTRRYDEAPDKMLKVGDLVEKTAKKLGKSPAQVAINWIRAQETKAPIIPILGARTVEQVKDNLGALKFKLNKKQVEELSEASSIDLGFPTDFLVGGVARKLIFGEIYDKIEKH